MNLDVSGSSSSPEVLSVSMLDQVYRLPPLPPTSLTLDDSMSGAQRVFPVRTQAVGPIQTSAQALEARGLFFFLGHVEEAGSLHCPIYIQTPLRRWTHQVWLQWGPKAWRLGLPQGFFRLRVELWALLRTSARGLLWLQGWQARGLEIWLATRVFPVKSGAVGLTTN